jgi:hypothetical protein
MKKIMIYRCLPGDCLAVCRLRPVGRRQVPRGPERGVTESSTHRQVRVLKPMPWLSCKASNTAAGIPVLEKALKDGKASLPSRN